MAEDITGSGVKIRVCDLQLLADIGINADEIGRRQPLVISIELTVDTLSPKQIEETIDYRRIASAAESLADTHIPLIETFAQTLGTEYLSWPLVREARIVVDKPFALTRGLASVEIAMRRHS